MSLFKIFTLCVLICATLAAEQDDSCSVNQKTSDDNTVMMPKQVLDQLRDIGGKSNGLFTLWKYASKLIKDKRLKDKVRVTSVDVAKLLIITTTCAGEDIIIWWHSIVLYIQLVILVIFTTV